MRSLSCVRGTTWSTKPCSRRNSDRWKPFGSFSPIVSLVTRAPEKPMSAPGSARTMSPSDANDARTPPVVGSVSTLMNGMAASSRRATAATVFASCMSAIVPSCMRAPPDADTITSGLRSAYARSAVRVSFSPTTLPIEPPMNSKSITASATGIPAICASPVRTASLWPLFACAAAMRSGYGLLSTNPSGSLDTMSASVSLNDFASAKRSMRSSAPSLKWWPHF